MTMNDPSETGAIAAGTPVVDVCINGAGPVGATLACRLTAAGMKVLLIDRAALPGQEDPSFDGRAYTIAEGSRRMLAAAGVWTHLGDRPQPIRAIHVIDGQPHRRPSSWSLDFTEEDADGPFGFTVEARDLRTALNTALTDREGLILRAPDTARFTFDAAGVTVQLASGETYRASLAVAAEGRRSPLRDQAGIGVTRLPYDQCGIITVIAHEKPHHGRALEHFLPQGPFARLPLAGNAGHPHRSAIVWADGTLRAQRAYALPDDVFAREIAGRMGDDALGDITPLGRRWIYPLSAQYAQRYVGPRLALAGDSAHGLHPIAGQGLNAGFKDIVALSALLEEAKRRGDDLGDAQLLMHYQRRARPDNMMMLAACDGLERLFGNDNPALRLARDWGLKTMNRMPGLKRAFVRRAMGL